MSRFQIIPHQFYNVETFDVSTKVKQHIEYFAAKNMQKTKKFFTIGMQKIKDFGEWLSNYIPPKPKVVDKVLESFKNKIKKNL